MQAATDKQISYILALASKITGRKISYLSQCKDVLVLTGREARGGMTRAEASHHIEALLEEVNT